MPVETQVGAREWNRVELYFPVLRTAVDQDAVPINLQVRCDANLRGARRQLAGEIGRDRARAACGETHVVDDAHPAAARVERLDVRRDRVDLGLVRSVDAGRGEVLG